MKKKREGSKRFVIFIVIVAIVVMGIAVTLFYFKYISYPRDKNGMVNCLQVNCEGEKVHID